MLARLPSGAEVQIEVIGSDRATGLVVVTGGPGNDSIAIDDTVPATVKVRANGNADNMASVTVVEVATKLEGTAIQLVELKYLTYLDMWLTAIQSDTRQMSKAQKSFIVVMRSYLRKSVHAEFLDDNSPPSVEMRSCMIAA